MILDRRLALIFNRGMNNVTGPHCQSCGSTSAEDIANLADTEGYTRCCNERVVNPVTYRTNWGTGKTEEIPVACADSNDCYHD